MPSYSVCMVRAGWTLWNVGVYAGHVRCISNTTQEAELTVCAENPESNRALDLCKRKGELMRIVYFTYWGTIGDRVLEWMVNNTDEEIIAVVSRPGDQGESIKDIAFRHYLPLYEPSLYIS